MGAGVCNSDPHTCTASTFPTAPSPIPRGQSPNNAYYSSSSPFYCWERLLPYASTDQKVLRFYEDHRQNSREGNWYTSSAALSLRSCVHHSSFQDWVMEMGDGGVGNSDGCKCLLIFENLLRHGQCLTARGIVFCATTSGGAQGSRPCVVLQRENKSTLHPLGNVLWECTGGT